MAYGVEFDRDQPPLWFAEEAVAAERRSEVVAELAQYDETDVLLTGETVEEHRKQLPGKHATKQLVS